MIAKYTLTYPVLVEMAKALIVVPSVLAIGKKIKNATPERVSL